MNRFPGLPLAVFVIYFSFFYTGCTDPAKTLRESVAATAGALEADFRGIRVDLDTMTSDLESVYAKAESLDLSTFKLDKAKGGIFDYFRTVNGILYYKTTEEGCSYYCSPADSIVTPAIKREIRLMQYQEPFLVQAFDKYKDIISVTFFGINQPSTVAIMYPRVDVISILQPKISLTTFEWFNRGINSPGKALWSKVPFTDLITGWVMDVSKPVRDESKVKGAAVISIAMNKLSSKYLLNQNKFNIMLLGPDTTIVAVTPQAKKILNVKVLEDFNYVQQMRENTFVPDNFRLNGNSQSKEIQELAGKILEGQADFQQTIRNRESRFIVRKVPEVGFYVVGIF